MDELPEFARVVLEALRQPLEDGRVVIARAQAAVAYPARFMLVAAMNPCPCGFAGDATRVCICTENDIQRYRARLSGPLLDRIDLHVTLSPISLRTIGNVSAEPSGHIRTRVESARARQRSRFSAGTASCNAQMSGRSVLRLLTHDAREMLDTAAESLSLSARAYHRVAKVALTIADLAEASAIASAHVAEALRYRPRAALG